MLSSGYILVLLTTASTGTLAALNGHCTGSLATGVWKENGICITTTTCGNFGGEYKTGACPNDPNDVKCCVLGLPPNGENNPCGGVSYCDWTANVCGGTRISNKCPGGSNFKCCKTG